MSVIASRAARDSRAAVLFVCFLAPVARAEDLQREAAACAGVATLKLPDTSILQTEPIPAGDFAAPDGKRYRVNAFCRVRAVSRPTGDSQIHFEVWMPQSGWNGRYYQHGQGGGGGAVNYNALTAFVNQGAAGGATDNGHAKDERLSYDWGYGHPEKIVDFGYRALQVTRDRAQQAIEKFYGKAAHHYYFAGCSGGGAEAMMAAQRFPGQWDGILAGAPDQDAIGFFASSAWQAHRWLVSPEGRIPPDKLPLIQRAAVASCSAEAHLDNGIPADPRFCRFDPGTLLCQHSGQSECLTSAQVQTLRYIYDGPRYRRTHKPIYHGFPATVEEGWATFITGGGAFPAKPFYQDGEPASLAFATKFFRAFVFDDLKWDLRSLRLERDVGIALKKRVAGETLASAQNATLTDMSALRDRGAKLILYIGWGDTAISPLNIIDYYDSVARTMGGEDSVRRFSRLFAVPGMQHCAGGPGASAFGQMPGFPQAAAVKNDAEHDVLRALESWVEEGRAPDGLVAAKYVDGDAAKGVAYTRPLCAYPRVPVYKGAGSKDLAQNFSCVEGRDPGRP